MGNVTLPKPVRCPECGGVDVRRSYPQGLRDAIMIRWGKPPLRCRGCTHRFYYKMKPDEKLGRPDPSTSSDEPIM